VKPFAEQMITLGKRGDLAARRQAIAELRSQDAVHKLFAEVAPRFAERPGGYTRIVKIGPRQGDAAEMAYLELVDYVPPAPRPKRVRQEEPEEAELEQQAVPGVTT
jgi:large subunit ribosomal protein L17